jgi:hypothetical protein
MNWSKSAPCSFVAIVLSLSAAEQNNKTMAQIDAETGFINGTVRYEDGRPTKGATVYAVPLGRPMAAIIPNADTDESGNYRIDIPSSWFGEFAVAAKKEDEGYPDMSMQFYSGGKFETVTLTPSNRASTLSIRLGPKAGVLLGTVADAVTGAPLVPCYEFTRASEPDNSRGGMGLIKSNYRVLIPADTNILMKIWLDGYKPWYYPGITEKSTSQAVRLGSGEQKIVDIALRPDNQTAKAGCPAVVSSPDLLGNRKSEL